MRQLLAGFEGVGKKQVGRGEMGVWINGVYGVYGQESLEVGSAIGDQLREQLREPVGLRERTKDLWFKRDFVAGQLNDGLSSPFDLPGSLGLRFCYSYH